MNRYLKHLFGHFKSLKINLPNIYIYNKYKCKRWLKGQKNHIFYFKREHRQINSPTEIRGCVIHTLYLENHWKSLRILEKSIEDILYIQDLSVACILWFPHVDNLNLTAPLTPRWCFISWQEVTDLAPGRHRAAGQRISVCSQGGSNYGHSDVWFLRGISEGISEGNEFLSETHCPPLLVLYNLESDEIVLQNTVLKRVFSWRAAQLRRLSH